MKKVILALVAVLSLSVAAFAADFSGKWVPDPSAAAAGGGQGRGGGRGGMQAWTFKVEGAKLSGSLAGGQGEPTAIADGKVDGDNFSFSITRAGRNGGDPMKVEYKGAVKGDKLELTSDRGRGPQTQVLMKAPN